MFSYQHVDVERLSLISSAIAFIQSMSWTMKVTQRNDN